MRLFQSVQQAYYSWLGCQPTRKKWVKLLIVQLFNVLWDMWEHHNAIKHNTVTAAKLHKIQSLDNSVHSEYSIGTTNLSLCNQKWLSLPIDTILKEYDTNQKQQWIMSVAQARIRWKR